MQNTLKIWKFTDEKQGHVSQSDGLIAAIRKSHDVIESVVDVNELPSALFMFFSWLFRKRPIIFPKGAPDLIVGAGHKTHASMLLASSLCGGKTIVLMKPSLPLRQFDYVVVPKHDQVEQKPNVIETLGALNTVPFVRGKNLQMGLMLIGGESKHYVWANEQVVKQIKQIVERDEKISWTLTTSRRTSESFSQLLDGLGVEVVPFEETDAVWLREKYKSSGRIWVTPDSVSMVYESLSSGAMTSVFSLAPSKAPSRVRNGLEQLMKNTLVGSFDGLEDGPIREQVPSEFNESERVANIILDDII
jgi:mitochondrial fission protein ELM1